VPAQILFAETERAERSRDETPRMLADKHERRETAGIDVLHRLGLVIGE
jgi:hypothetical protein